MPTPQNMLDHLADCAHVCGDDFPGDVFKRSFRGAHGSVTQELVIVTADGDVFQITLNRVPKEAEAEVLKDAH